MNRAQKKREIYNNYIKGFEERYAKFAPLRELPFDETHAVMKQVNCVGGLKPISSQANYYRQGMIHEYCGLFVVDGKFIELVYYRENPGSLANYVAHEYATVEDHREFRYPLSQHYYFNR